MSGIVCAIVPDITLKSYNMTKEQILSLALTEEQAEQVNRMFTAYERLAGSNPNYPVPFSDCGDNQEVIKFKINEKLKEYKKKNDVKVAKQQKAAQAKLEMDRIIGQVKAALQRGKTVDEIEDALKNL